MNPETTDQKMAVSVVLPSENKDVAQTSTL